MTQEEIRIVISQHAKTLAYWLDTKADAMPNGIIFDDIRAKVRRIADLSADLKPLNTQT